MELKGLGFRGVVFGKMLTYGFAMNEERQLLINGKIADNERTYKLDNARFVYVRLFLS
ncbi:hypothetical protein LSPH24S_03267 [Lysinibacillus sphaericus]